MMTTSAMQLDLFSHQPAAPVPRRERTPSGGRRWPAAAWVPAGLLRSAIARPQARVIALQLGDQADAPVCQIGAVALRRLLADMRHATQLRITPAGQAVTIELQTAGSGPNARMLIRDGAWVPTSRRARSAPAAGSAITIILTTR